MRNSYNKSYISLIWLTKTKTGLHNCSLTRPELPPKHKWNLYLQEEQYMYSLTQLNCNHHHLLSGNMFDNHIPLGKTT